jgi:hypothetical protein
VITGNNAHPTMAPRKHLPKTAEAARNDGCNLVTDFFKKNRAGRPKKRRNSANDDVQAQPAISNKKKKRGLLLPLKTWWQQPSLL